MSHLVIKQVEKPEHWSTIKMKHVIAKKMNAIGQSGVEEESKEKKYENARTFQHLVIADLASVGQMVPGTYGIKCYSTSNKFSY